MKEYLPEDEIFGEKYDKETGKESVRYTRQVLKDIIETNDEKERLADNLKISLSWNQHIDMLIEEERSEQHTEVLPKEEEVQKPYIFYYDDCLIIEDVVVETGIYLAQVDNQMKEEEKEHLLKDVKEDLAEEEGRYDDWSVSNEEMGDCVKFPNCTPNKIIELYKELDLQRRKLEKQRIKVQDKLLKKEDKGIVINDSQEEVDRYSKQKQKFP